MPSYCTKTGQEDLGGSSWLVWTGTGLDGFDLLWLGAARFLQGQGCSRLLAHLSSRHFSQGWPNHTHQGRDTKI